MSSIPSTTTSSPSANTALQEAAQSIISGSTGNSGIDVNTLVTALVNGKTGDQANLLSTAIASDTSTVSALGTLQSALSNLQGALGSLANGSFGQTFTAAASSNSFSATAGVTAVAGTYSVSVGQIAQSQSLSSPAFSATQTLGTGTLTLSLGGASSTITIDATNNTLPGIQNAINSASGNPGVTATIVSGADGMHLVLRSTRSGAASTIGLSVDATTDAGLSNLGVTSTPNATGGQSTITSAGITPQTQWIQSAAAQDAQLTIGGIACSSPTNTVTNALAGVTLNLTQAAVGATAQTLTIATDTNTQASTITNFVSQYNAAIQAVAKLGAFDNTNPQNPVIGALVGDSTLNAVRRALASAVGGAITRNGTAASLQALGITIADGSNPAQPAGSLIVDSTALNTALQSNPTIAATVFNGTNGIGAQLDTAITTLTQPSGTFATRTSALNADMKRLADQQTALSQYAQQLTNQYQAQFTALNTLMARMNQNANYLTQLFGGANSAGTLAANK